MISHLKHKWFLNSCEFIDKKNIRIRHSLVTVLVFMLIGTIDAIAQDRKISGTVIDKTDGSSLPGVSVKLKETTTGTLTNNDGRFTLSLTPQKNVLVISYIGYATKEVTVVGSESLTIALSTDTKQLQEVVVSGYSSQRKKDFTGAASTIKNDQLENRPVQSFDQALAGQAPGVSVVQPSGVLNNPPVFRIRGTNSISLSSYPLIIIDGIAVFTGSIGNNAPNNPLADINPDDIASLNILKDASATAIYGSRAANGVVVITTKKGKGKTKVTYDAYAGFSQVMNLPKLLNAEQFVTIKNEARANSGLAPAFFLQEKADGSVVETNWYDYAYRTGVSQSHNLSISGGTDATSFFVSLGYTDQDGVLKNNSFNRKVARVNLDHKLFKNFTIGTNFSYSNSLNKSPYTGSLPGEAIAFASAARLTYLLPPNVSPYNEDGSYNITTSNSLGMGANTVLVNNFNLVPIIDKDRYSSESNTLIGAVFAEWEFVKGLSFKTNYSINTINAENQTFNSPIHGTGFALKGQAINVSRRYNRTDWTNTLTYNTTFAKVHNFNILAGYEEIYTTSNSWGAVRTNLTDVYFTTYQGGYSVINPSGNLQGLNGFRSYFSGVNYDFDKKYLLSASFRRDGFSGLSDKNKYGDFYGGSIGWNISEEGFFKTSTLSNTITGLKLRTSYGQVGNINLGDFPSSFFYASGLYGSVATLGFSQAGNRDLQWETSKKTDIGLDVELFKGRLAIGIDYYNNIIDGMVLNARQTPSLGIPLNIIAQNVGSMYNRGIEVSLTGQIIKKGDFKWSSNLNISTLKNKVTALANGNADIYNSNGVGTQNITRVGYPVGSIFSVPTTGVNPETGQRIYINRNGQKVQFNFSGNPQWTYLDGTRAPAIDGILDAKVSGSSMPTYYGGFNNTFTYKGFDLIVGITFSGGNYIYNGTRAALMDQRGFNNLVDVLNRWTPTNKNTDIPKVVYSDTYSSGYTITNSSNVEDASFIRLKNTSLGYKFPANITSKLRVSSLRIYAQASNLATITKYTGSDPEISSNGDSNVGQGLDNISSAGARTYTFGLNIGF